MITHLHGKLLEKRPPSIVIDVNGVGYEVQAPMSTFYHLPEINESITLLTHLSISENSHQLFGFISNKERQLFRVLIKVSGVGPKLALTILSGIECDQFAFCIRSQDMSTLVRIPGVGKKTAERLIIETRDTLAQWENHFISDDNKQHNPSSQSIDEAISALTSLGYKPADSKRIIHKVYQSDLNAEQLIRLALQQMIRNPA